VWVDEAVVDVGMAVSARAELVAAAVEVDQVECEPVIDLTRSTMPSRSSPAAWA